MPPLSTSDVPAAAELADALADAELLPAAALDDPDVLLQPAIAMLMTTARTTAKTVWYFFAIVPIPFLFSLDNASHYQLADYSHYK